VDCSPISRRKVDLGHCYDAETSRSIAEEGRAVRQEISRIKGRREYVGEVLGAEAGSLVEIFDTGIRPTADTAAAQRFEQLARQARGSIEYGNMEDAKKSISEMRGIFLDEVLKQPGFLVNMFFDLANERALAVDKGQHGRLVEEGNAMIERNDLNGLRSVLGQMRQNRIPMDPKSSSEAALAGLMKK
jgi:molecular chaperone DnaK